MSHDGNQDTFVIARTKVLKVSTGWDYYSLILNTDSTLYACGYNDYGQLGNGTTTTQTTPVKVMSNVKSMSVGNNFSLIVKNDGSLWTCGKNSNGQLGNGTKSTTQSTPVRIRF